MKSILFKMSVLVIVALSFSCSSDDGSGKHIRYEIIADIPMIAHIEYRKANGDMQEVNDVTGAEWEKAVHAELPFTADLDVIFNNTTPNAESYTLLIYVGGSDEPAAAEFGLVPANVVYNDAVSLLVTE